MDNSVKWVNTYFQQRRLNSQNRPTGHSGYPAPQAVRDKSYYRVLNSSTQTVSVRDVTDELNWMVGDLLAHSSYQTFVSTTPESLVNSPENVPLSAAEKHHIRLKEGKNAGVKALVFRADTAQMLETRWPTVLRDDAFDKARNRFETARDAALAQLKAQKKLDKTAETQLMKAVDQLSDELNAAYPQDAKHRRPMPSMAI